MMSFYTEQGSEKKILEIGNFKLYYRLVNEDPNETDKGNYGINDTKYILELSDDDNNRVYIHVQHDLVEGKNRDAECRAIAIRFMKNIGYIENGLNYTLNPASLRDPESLGNPDYLKDPESVKMFSKRKKIYTVQNGTKRSIKLKEGPVEENRCCKFIYHIEGIKEPFEITVIVAQSDYNSVEYMRSPEFVYDKIIKELENRKEIPPVPNMGKREIIVSYTPFTLDETIKTHYTESGAQEYIKQKEDHMNPW